METSFFRFSEKATQGKDTVYSTVLMSILGSTFMFIGVVAFFFQDIIGVLRYQEHPEFIIYLFAILCLDVIAAIPFARLREQNRAVRFVSIKLTLIGVNVLMNLFFFKYCEPAIQNNWLGAEFIQSFFEPQNMLQYVFISNLIASSIMLIMLLPEFFNIKWNINKALWKQMMIYGLPLMVAGLAGVANEMLDRQFIKYLLPKDISMAQLGIYGAVYKLSIFLVLFNQAFRYAAEPFFFSTEKEKNSKNTIAVVMKYFTLVMTVGFVFVMSYIDILKHFIDEKFWEGLYILPILLLANVFLGINTNLSIWYKLTDKTKYGIVITGVGLVLTIGLNLYLIPLMGYEGAAWATLASYFAMTVTSYFLGQKHYKIKYPVGKMAVMIILSIIAVGLAGQWSNSTFVPQTLVFLSFVITLALIEKKDLIDLKNRIQNR